MKTYLLSCFTLFVAFQIVSAQTVTTITEGTPDDAIAIRSDGSIYASNFEGDAVFTYDPSGAAQGTVDFLFNTPNGIAFDSNDYLYVCDWQGNTIYQFDASEDLLASVIIIGRPSGMIKAIDNDDMIYTRYSGNTINRITAAGSITQISNSSLLNGPVGLAYDDAGDLYVGNYNNRNIYRVLSNGDLEYVANVGSSSNLGFIAYAQGMLWGTVLGEHKIYKINPNAVDDVTLFAGSVAGSTDGDISVATFNQPNGIIFDDTETTMYVTDFGTKNLRVISGITLGVSEVSSEEISVTVYPNPARDSISISGISEGEKLTLRIYDLSGKLVQIKELETQQGIFSDRIRIASFARGAYFIELSNGKHTTTKKFLK